MNKKVEAVTVLLIVAVGGFFLGQLVFDMLIDTTLVPLFGFRPVFSAVTTKVIYYIIYKLVDSKYHFEEKGGKLFKDTNLFKK